MTITTMTISRTTVTVTAITVNPIRATLEDAAKSLDPFLLETHVIVIVIVIVIDMVTTVMTQ